MEQVQCVVHVKMLYELDLTVCRLTALCVSSELRVLLTHFSQRRVFILGQVGKDYSAYMLSTSWPAARD